MPGLQTNLRKILDTTNRHGACDIGKWSDFFPVCGIIVVKRKITAKLAVIFLKNGGPNRDRTDDLTDANRTLSQLSYRPIYNFTPESRER